MVRLGILGVLFLAQALHAYRLPVQNFTTRRGLPRNSVLCLLSGANGVLWVCTTEGLSRFDGQNFRTFGPEQGLPSRIVMDIAPAPHGGYWIVTDLGVCRLTAQSKIGEPCRLLPGSQPIRTGSIIKSPGDTAWLTTDDAMYRIDGESRMLRTDFQVADTVRSSAHVGGNRLLIGTDHALYVWREGQAAEKLSTALGDMGVSDIFVLSASRVLLATSRGLCSMKLDSKPEFSCEPAGAPGVTQIIRVRDGSFRMATRRGLSSFRVAGDGQPVDVQPVDLEMTVPLHGFTAIAEDAQGTLYTAATGAGIFRIQDTGISTYRQSDGLGTEGIAALLEDRKGHVGVIGGWDGRILLHAYEENRFAPIRIPFPPGFTRVGWGWSQYGLQAKSGEWWMPTSDGLFRFAAEDIYALPRARLVKHYTARDEYGCDEPFRVFEDSQGDIWTGCLTPSKLLIRWNHSTERFEHWRMDAEGLPAGTWITAIREAQPGVVWLGTSKGMVRLANGKLTHFPLVENRLIALVRDANIDRSGRLWVATVRDGLFRCDRPADPHPVFTAYTTREGLSSNATRSIAFDHDGFVYVGTVRGVDRIDPRLAREAHLVRHMTPDDGLPDSEQNAALTDSQGRLWFGALQGLSIYEPKRAPELAAPQVYISRVKVRGVDVPVAWEGERSLALNLDAERNQVEIEFGGSDPRNAAALLYQYRLGGEWSQPSPSLTVNYPSLSPGSFRFEVRAINANGEMSVMPGSIELNVQAPWWRRWWVICLEAAFLISTATILYRYRVRHLLAVERLRMRIATDLHDDIGASLSQIAILSEVARRNGQQTVLAEISGIARETVEQMSDIVWAVNPHHDRFGALLHRMRRFASDTLGGADIRLQFESEHLDPNLSTPIEIRRPLYLVFKEAVNNIVRHSRANSAVIHMEVADSALLMRIEDNGRGFETSTERDGEGISSITRRIGSIGGSAEWDSAPGAGTTLTVKVPLRARRSHIN